LATTTSGLPSPFTSATAIEVLPEPPESYVTTGRKLTLPEFGATGANLAAGTRWALPLSGSSGRSLACADGIVGIGTDDTEDFSYGWAVPDCWGGESDQDGEGYDEQNNSAENAHVENALRGHGRPPSLLRTVEV
jgi:hypothetical protein